MPKIDKLWMPVFAAIGASWLSLGMSGVTVIASSGIIPLLLIPVLGIGARAALTGGERAGSVILADTIHGISLFATLSLAGALASYAVAARSAGWYDADIVKVGRFMGFYWLDLYNFYAKQPALIMVGRTAYSTIALSPILIIAGLSCMRRPDLVQRLLHAFAIVLAPTIAIFAFVPLKGAFTALVPGVPTYAPITMHAQARIIAGLRDGSIDTVDLRALTGIISFPSIHTAAGILFAWAAWPIRVYRWPMIVINAAMIAATPIEGAHYLADLIGGAMLALSAIALTTIRWPALPMRHALRSSPRFSVSAP